MTDYLEILADFAAALKFETLPTDVVEQTKLYIADYYAASFAGYKVNCQFNEAITFIFREFGGNEQSTVLFEARKYPASVAAFINAIYSHGADMDDGNKKSAGHIGTHVIPAVFAVAEWMQLNWKDVIVAINTGYEFFNRIAGAAQPFLYQRGFHSTGVAGSIACAAACAKLLKLNKNQIYDAVSIAAVQSSGLIIIDESGQGCKPINPGNAARVGVFSAFLASKSIVTPRNPLQSKKGWFNAFSRDCNIKIALEDLGRVFTITESYLKLYPSCRHTHSCIDAILNLRSKLEQQREDWYNFVDSIDVYIYPSAIKSAGQIIKPQNADEAKFSIAYAISVAAIMGRFSLLDLSVSDADIKIFDLAEKVRLIADSTMEDRSKDIRGCKVIVNLEDGQYFENTVLKPRGEGLLALSWKDMYAKMKLCSIGVLEQQQIDDVFKKCRNINVENRFETFLSELQPSFGT